MRTKTPLQKKVDHKGRLTSLIPILSDWTIVCKRNIHNELFALATDITIRGISCLGNWLSTRCSHVLYHIPTGWGCRDILRVSILFRWTRHSCKYKCHCAHCYYYTKFSLFVYTFRPTNFFIVNHLVDCRLLIHRSIRSHKVDAVVKNGNDNYQIISK